MSLPKIVVVAGMAVASSVVSVGLGAGTASAIPTGCSLGAGSQTTTTYCSGGTGQHRAKHFCGSGVSGGFQYGSWTSPGNFSTAGSCSQEISNRTIQLR